MNFLIQLVLKKTYYNFILITEKKNLNNIN